MKLQLNVGDWATIALFALGTVLGCYAAEHEPKARAKANASTTPAHHSGSMRTAVASRGLE